MTQNTTKADEGEAPRRFPDFNELVQHQSECDQETLNQLFNFISHIVPNTPTTVMEGHHGSELLLREINTEYTLLYTIINPDLEVLPEGEVADIKMSIVTAVEEEQPSVDEQDDELEPILQIIFSKKQYATTLQDVDAQKIQMLDQGTLEDELKMYMADDMYILRYENGVITTRHLHREAIFSVADSDDLDYCDGSLDLDNIKKLYDESGILPKIDSRHDYDSAITQDDVNDIILGVEHVAQTLFARNGE